MAVRLQSLPRSQSGGTSGSQPTTGQPLDGDYPTRPVTIVTGIGAGGGPDIILRIVAGSLGQAWNRQVVVINRPGANSSLAVQAVAKAGSRRLHAL